VPVLVPLTVMETDPSSVFTVNSWLNAPAVGGAKARVTVQLSPAAISPASLGQFSKTKSAACKESK